MNAPVLGALQVKFDLECIYTVTKKDRCKIVDTDEKEILVVYFVRNEVPSKSNDLVPNKKGVL